MKKQKEKQQKKQHDLNRGKENNCFYPSEKEAKEARDGCPVSVIDIEE